MSELVTLIFILVLLVLQFYTFVQGQSTTEGFLNIDCGLPKDRTYNSTFYGLLYISDYEFTDTGESQIVSSEFFTPNSPESYLRSFPNGTRNCYKIKPVVEGWKYLVRVRFMYGNYDGLDKFPQFDVYLGINYWATLYKMDVNSIYNMEIIAVAVSNSISVCLVNTNQGIPFISAIELRPLPNTLYSEVNISQSLAVFTRQNLGGIFSRYPEDIYDRFWFTDRDEIQPPAVKTLNTSSTVLTSSSFEEPLDVMQTLVYPNETATDLTSKFSMKSVGTCSSSTRAYFVLYFAELEKLMRNESRILHVSVDDVVVSDEIQPEYLKTIAFEKYITFSGNRFTLSVANVSGSTKPPILNALEVCKFIDMTCQSETRTLDIDAITGIKAFYEVKRNWNGDPCAPKDYMWEGLNCTFNGSNSHSVTSLNLSSSGLSGSISASFANLTALHYLDLSNNALTGPVPESLSSLSQLKFLSLANNNLTGSIPGSLLELSRNGYLNLSTEGNPFLCSNLDSCLNGIEKNRTVENPSSNRNGKLMVIVLVSCIVVVVLVVSASIVFWRYRRRPRTVVSDVQSKDGLSPLHSDKTQFTYDELVKITNNFTKQIGKGGFGTVYHGTSNLGVQVAVKMLSHSSSQGLEQFQTEAKLLTRIHHRNLVPLIGYCNEDTDHLALVYEYMEGGSLQDNLMGKNNRIPLSWRERLRVAFEAAQGLEYLHKYCRPCIVHRDVKTSNILLTKNLEARIADFGLSRLFEDDGISTVRTRVVGTRGYLDPDYHNNNQLRERSDVYSFGVVLMELITGLPAIIIKQEESIHIVQWVQEKFVGGDVSEIVDERIRGDYDVNYVTKLVEVANACTNVQSVQRPDITEVVAILKDCLEHSVAHDRGHRLGNANEHRGTSLSYQMTLDSQSSMVRPHPR